MTVSADELLTALTIVWVATTLVISMMVTPTRKH